MYVPWGIEKSIHKVQLLGWLHHQSLRKWDFIFKTDKLKSIAIICTAIYVTFLASSNNKKNYI